MLPIVEIIIYFKYLNLAPIARLATKPTEIPGTK